MKTLFGMNVLTSALVQPVPILQISPTFEYCTNSFRDEMNKWLLDMFGTKEVAYVIGGNMMVMNKKMLEKIKHSIPRSWDNPSYYQ